MQRTWNAVVVSSFLSWRTQRDERLKKSNLFNIFQRTTNGTEVFCLVPCTIYHDEHHHYIQIPRSFTTVAPLLTMHSTTDHHSSTLSQASVLDIRFPVIAMSLSVVVLYPPSPRPPNHPQQFCSTFTLATFRRDLRR